MRPSRISDLLILPLLKIASAGLGPSTILCRGWFSDKPHAVWCFLRIPCPLGLVGCGARLCVILLYELGEENQTVQELQLPIKGQEKESTVPSAAPTVLGILFASTTPEAKARAGLKKLEIGRGRRSKTNWKLRRQKLAAATPSGWLYEPETPSESSLTMEWRSYNPGHNMARQLRPFFHWSVPARKLAWLRSWRLCGWWRVLS